MPAEEAEAAMAVQGEEEAGRGVADGVCADAAAGLPVAAAAAAAGVAVVDFAAAAAAAAMAGGSVGGALPTAAATAVSSCALSALSFATVAIMLGSGADRVGAPRAPICVATTRATNREVLLLWAESASHRAAPAATRASLGLPSR